MNVEMNLSDLGEEVVVILKSRLATIIIDSGRAGGKQLDERIAYLSSQFKRPFCTGFHSWISPASCKVM